MALNISAWRAWLRLARVEHAFIAAFAVIAAEALVAHRFDVAFLYPALAPFLVTIASFVANDYYDYASDKALKRRDRPLVSGEISRKTAFYAAIALYVLALAAAAPLPRTAFFIILVYAGLSIAYNAFLKRLPLVGNAFIASSMAVSFLYGNLVISPSLNYYVALFCVVSFSAGLGREFLITLRDVAGDKKIKAVTLPMLLGAKRTVIAANALIYFAVVLSLLPLAGKMFFLPYAVLVLAADALFIAVVLKTSLAQGMDVKERKETLRFARNASLWALLLGTLAFASLALA